jgi:two-component system CheB/CheR fusion protein
LTLAQDPDTAKFDSMPRSAIESGLVDLVRPANELPAALRAFLKHPTLRPESTCPKEPGLDKALILLRDRTGHDFSAYKSATIRRRIERRMNIHHIDNMEGYVHYLRDNPGEVDLLFRELLIGVTSGRFSTGDPADIRQ